MVSRNSFHHEQLGPNKNVCIGVGQHSKTEGLEKIGDPFLIGKNFFETFPDIKRNLSKTFWLKIIDKLPSTWLAPKKRNWKSAFYGSEFLGVPVLGWQKVSSQKSAWDFFFQTSLGVWGHWRIILSYAEIRSLCCGDIWMSSDLFK